MRYRDFADAEASARLREFVAPGGRALHGRWLTLLSGNQGRRCWQPGADPAVSGACKRWAGGQLPGRWAARGGASILSCQQGNLWAGLFVLGG